MFPVCKQWTGNSSPDFVIPVPPLLPTHLRSTKRVPPLLSLAGLGVTGSCGPGIRAEEPSLTLCGSLGDSPISCVGATVPRLCPALSRRAPVVLETLSPPVIPVCRPQIRRALG